MINIKREITNPHILYLTKVVLYRTRTEKGLEAYRLMKRLVYVAYRMGGYAKFIAYDAFLKSVLIWLDRGESIYNFTSLSHKSHIHGIIFGLNANIVLKGTYAQIEQEILNFIEKHQNSTYYE